MIYKRNIPGSNVQDPSVIEAMQYSDAAGSKKVSEVGRHHLPLKFVNAGAVAYTTDASTIRQLDNLGACLAVYNNSAAVHAVTLGEASTQTALAAGVTDSTGHVGVPCMPNAWTYIACATSKFVITDNAALLVFLIDDNTTIQNEQPTTY